MKLIKLDRRHTLYHKGYSHAFRFDNWEPKASYVEHAVKKMQGWRACCTSWGKVKHNAQGMFFSRPFYIGINDEATASMVLLSTDFE